MATLPNGSFAMFLEIAIKALLMLLLGAAVAGCARRASAALRHFIWTVSIVGVLSLPLLVATLPQSNLLPDWLDPTTIPTAKSTETVSREIPTKTATQNPVIGSAADPSATSVIVNPGQGGAAAFEPLSDDAFAAGDPKQAGTPSDFGWLSVLPALVVAIWFAGAGFVCVMTALGILRLVRLARSAADITGSPTGGLLRDLGRRLGVNRNVKLLRSADASIPATWSLLRPCVLVPDDFESWPRERQQAVLLHELAHVRRSDHAVQLLTRLACAIYWFNPLAWFASRQIEREREQACDDIVLGLGERPSDYAEHLLRVAVRCCRKTAPAGSLAIRMARRADVSDRIHSVLDEARRREPVSGRVIACGTAIAALVVVTLAILDSSKVAAQPAPPQAAAVEGDDRLPNGAVMRLGTDRFRQEGEVSHLQYSPDGKKIASTSYDCVIVWEAATGRLLKRLRPRGDREWVARIRTLAFTPDGQEIAAADRSRITIWEVETGLELLSIPINSEFGPGDFQQIVYSPDGSRLALSGELSVSLFDTATGSLVKQLTLENHRAVFHGLCWTPDGTHLSAATLQPAAITWNVETGEPVRRFEVENLRNFSFCPTMSADGKWLIAATGGVVHFWNFADGEYVRNIDIGMKLIHSLALTPDGKTLIAGSQDSAIHIVDVESGKIVRTIEGGLWLGRSMALSPDFETVALGAVYPTIRQWNVKTGEERLPEVTSAGHDGKVRCVAYSPDGRLIASGGDNKRLILWDAATGTIKSRLPAPASANHVAFVRSGEQLLTSWESAGAIRIWDVETATESRAIDCGMQKVRAFVLSPDERQLVVIASNSRALWHSPVGEEAIQVWNFASGEKLREFTFKTASTTSAVLTRDGTTVVTGSGNGIVHVLDLGSGEEVAMLAGHQHSVGSVALSADGAVLASGSMDQTIRLWDTKTWRSRRVLKGEGRAVPSVAFSPNGRLLATGSGDDAYPLAPDAPVQIRVWDVDSGRRIGTLTGHDTNTSALAFSPDGRRLVSGHDNTTLLIWDVTRFDGR